MKKLFSLICLVVVTALYAGARDMVYHVGPFDRLAQMGNINVIYRSVPDSTGMACYYSERDYSDAIEITNNKGKLTIKEVPGHTLGQVPTIHVYSDYLSQIRNEGLSTVEAELGTATPTLSISLVGNGRIICDGIKSPEVSASITTGNGNVVLRGKCTEAKFKLTGAGVIQADELEASAVKCTAVGTGSIGCWATKTLDVRGVGTSKIYYRGLPTVKKVGGANISPLPDSPIKLDEAADDDESGEESEEEEDDEPTEVSADEEPAE